MSHYVISTSLKRFAEESLNYEESSISLKFALRVEDKEEIKRIFPHDKSHIHGIKFRKVKIDMHDPLRIIDAMQLSSMKYI